MQRDPVDIIETEPESFNPYQFVYNNPHVYIDPTGMITLTELLGGGKLKKILEGIQKQGYAEAKQSAIEGIQETITGFIARGLDSILPISVFDAPLVDAFSSGGRKWDIFEFIVADAICGIFGNPDFVWFGTEMRKSDGKPISDGAGCGITEPGKIQLPLLANGSQNNSADFMFSNVNPMNLDDNRFSRNRSFLVGDFKFSVRTMYERYIEKGDKTNQWEVFQKHAKNYQWVPVNSFITWSAGPKGAFMEEKLIKESARRGVIMFITSLKRSS